MIGHPVTTGRGFRQAIPQHTVVPVARTRRWQGNSLWIDEESQGAVPRLSPWDVDSSASDRFRAGNDMLWSASDFGPTGSSRGEKRAFCGRGQQCTSRTFLPGYPLRLWMGIPFRWPYSPEFASAGLSPIHGQPPKHLFVSVRGLQFCRAARPVLYCPLVPRNGQKI